MKVLGILLRLLVALPLLLLGGALTKAADAISRAACRLEGSPR